jgi:hypothetical protein
LIVIGWIVVPALAVLGLALLGSGLLTGVSHATVGDTPDTAATSGPTVADGPVATETPALVTAPPAGGVPTVTVDATAAALLAQLPATLPPPSDTPTPLPPPTDTPLPPPTATPTLEPALAEAAAGLNPLTGLPADPATLARVPLTIMLDNHPDAAPQTGLNEADVVYEALAEGGITRFMAIYLSQDPGTVGPVRSARPYYLEWARPFGSMYVHCGGSWEAIDLLKEWGMLTNVDCFNGTMPFWRSDDRVLPHNLYTSTSELWKLATRKGLAAPSPLPYFLHGPEVGPAARPAGGSVGFTFSTLSRSDIQWIYDPDTNSYRRKQWGTWHRDYESGQIVAAKNVAILFSHVWDLPGDEAGRMGTDTTGRNTALIASNGHFEWGYWSRETIDSPLLLWDGTEAPMRLAPGNLWIEAIGIGHKLTLDEP